VDAVPRGPHAPLWAPPQSPQRRARTPGSHTLLACSWRLMVAMERKDAVPWHAPPRRRRHQQGHVRASGLTGGVGRGRRCARPMPRAGARPPRGLPSSTHAPLCPSVCRVNGKGKYMTQRHEVTGGVRTAGHTLTTLPGPRGWPLVGNLFQLKVTQLPTILEQWADIYGPLYTFRLGRKPVVVLAAPD